jgi:hypothetical protein
LTERLEKLSLWTAVFTRCLFWARQ